MQPKEILPPKLPPGLDGKFSFSSNPLPIESSEELVTCKIPKNLLGRVLQVVEDEKIKSNTPKKQTPVKKRKSKVKGTWTKEEDEKLLELVSEKGAKKWPQIAEHIFGRNGKQCRERYLNHLDPTINHEEFSQEEDNFIVEYHAKHGNCWAKMSREMTGRPANMIKNRWNTTLQRIVGDGNGSKGATKKTNKRKRKTTTTKKTKTATNTAGTTRKTKTKKNKTPKKKKVKKESKKMTKKEIEELEEIIEENNFIRSSRIVTRSQRNQNTPTKKKEKEISPRTKSYFYPLPQTFKFDGIEELLSPRSSKHFELEEPPNKIQKVDGSKYVDLSLNVEDEIPNPFPSPRTVGSTRGNNVEEFYKSLAEKNKKINTMKGMSLFDDSSLDEKLGLSNGIQEIKKEDELLSMGYTKNSGCQSLSLNLDDSAIFASDYGINLGSPSILSLELWSPRFSEVGLKEEKTPNNYLKINIHPTVSLTK